MAGLALAVAGIGAGRMLVESVERARGSRAPTWASTRTAAIPASRGRLARSMTAPSGPPPRGRRRLLAVAWAAPTTAVGLVLAALSGGRWQYREDLGAMLVTDGRNPLLRIGGMAAQGIGHVIVVHRPSPGPRLLAHEAAHVRQAEVLGPATLPLYVWWLARHGYRNHPMERGARATAEQAGREQAGREQAGRAATTRK